MKGTRLTPQLEQKHVTKYLQSAGNKIKDNITRVSSIIKSHFKRNFLKYLVIITFVYKKFSYLLTNN